MNKKGQALVEFIIILPIFILLVFSAIDFGMIIYNKSKLENKLNDVVDMINNNEDNEKINEFININSNNKVSYKVTDKNEKKEIELYVSINIITPGLNILLNDPYKIEVSRVVYDKEQ